LAAAGCSALRSPNSSRRMATTAPRPKSPPASPDPCGRHRLQLAVDALHREIGFLEVLLLPVSINHADHCILPRHFFSSCITSDDFLLLNTMFFYV
jgi:hypothetical protein